MFVQPNTLSSFGLFCQCRLVVCIVVLIHFLSTPIDRYAKKQATVEIATYGSEFIAACICVDQSIDLKNTLHDLGVPVCKKAYMFGDNKTVADSSTVPHAKLTSNTMHHRREAIATAIIKVFFISVAMRILPKS